METKAPLPHVTVKIEGTEKSTLTDINGHFIFDKLCKTTHTITISCIGYNDTICEGYHEHGENTHFFLKQKINLINKVVIKAKRVNGDGTSSLSKDKLKIEDINVIPSQSLAETVSSIEGVSFTSIGNNIKLPVIHGLYGNRILVLNNGLKHGFQNWGTDHAPEIDIHAASSITVIKGAAGVRFGPEALGGAIIVEPNPLYLKKPTNIRFSSGYETNGKGYYGSINTEKGFEHISFSAGANYTKIGDRKAPDYNLTNSGKTEYGFNAGLRMQPHRSIDIKTYYSYFDQSLGILRSSIAESGESFLRALNAEKPLIVRDFSYDLNAPRQDIQHHLYKLEGTWWLSEESRITVRGGYQLNERQEYDVRRNSELPIINLVLKTNDFQVEFKHPKWLNLDGLAGFQFFTQNSDNLPNTGTTPFIPNYNTRRTSGFIVESMTVGKNTYEIGVRIDGEYNNVRGRKTNQDIFRDSYSFRNFTSSLGISHKFNDHTTFRSNIGSAWRSPNMAELFSFGQHGFKVSYGLLRYSGLGSDLSTDDVQIFDQSIFGSEKGFKWINELKYDQQRNDLTVSFYVNLIENFIYERPVALTGTVRGPMPAFIIDQADAAFIGTDITWQTKHARKLEGEIGSSFLWSRNVRDHETLINQPPITLNYKAIWNIGKIWKTVKNQITVHPSYTFKQFQAPRTLATEDLINYNVQIGTNEEIFDLTEAPAGYFLLNLGWNFEFKKFKAKIEVQNLLNNRYRNYLNEMRYFADEMGRNLVFNLSYALR